MFKTKMGNSNKKAIPLTTRLKSFNEQLGTFLNSNYGSYVHGKQVFETDESILDEASTELSMLYF